MDLKSLADRPWDRYDIAVRNYCAKEAQGEHVEDHEAERDLTPFQLDRDNNSKEANKRSKKAALFAQPRSHTCRNTCPQLHRKL